MPPSAAAPVDLSDVRLLSEALHRHDVDELTWVVSGSCTIDAGGRAWRIDEQTALVIPAGLEHRVVPRPDSIVFPLLFPDGVLSELALVRRSPALEACARVLLQPGLTTPEALGAARLAASELIGAADDRRRPNVPLDPRAEHVAQAILAAPASPTGLDEWGRRVHSSGRTLQRCFVRETGLTFAQWRTAARLADARERIDDGQSVSTAARAVGYRSTSAFIAAFRRHYGVTPGRRAS